MSTLLAIDPGRSYKGDASIGWCLFSEEEGGETGRIKWQEQARGSVSYEELWKRFRVFPSFDWEGVLRKNPLVLTFDDWTVDEVVCEDFVNDPQSARGGQRNGTSECIGAIELACLLTKTTFTRQKSDRLGPAKLHAGYVQKLKHLPHQDSAFLHGYYYLVSKGVLQAAGLQDTM